MILGLWSMLWVCSLIYKVPNARIRDLCGVKKGVDIKIDEGVLWYVGRGFVRANTGGGSPGGEPMTLTRVVGCHGFMKPLKGGSLSLICFSGESSTDEAVS